MGDGDLRLLIFLGEPESFLDLLGGDSEGCLVFCGGDSLLRLSLLGDWESSFLDFCLGTSGLLDLRLALLSGDLSFPLPIGDLESLSARLDFLTGDLESCLERLPESRSGFLSGDSRLDLRSGEPLEAFLGGEDETRLLFLGGDADSLFDCLFWSRLDFL